MKSTRFSATKIGLVMLVCLGWGFLSGCKAYNVGVQPRAPLEFLLTSEQTLGQTFTATYAGLAGLQLLLVPREPGEGNLLLHLRRGLDSVEDVATARLPVAEIEREGFYSVNFSSIKESSQTDYYVLLELEGQGVLAVGASEGESYLQGALYQDGSPQDAQLAFHLLYDSGMRASGLLKELLQWTGLLIVVVYLCVLPGWALLSLVWGEWKTLRWPERLGLACGVSLAVYPLLFLWTDVVFLHLGAFYAWLPGGVGLLYLLWRVYKRWQAGDRIRLKKINLSAPDTALLLILGLVIATRLWSVRTLDLSMWGDSVHHTMITQLLLDHNGLFSSWQPYANIELFSYHFGFHSFSAVFSWIISLPPTKAVLYAGQIINVLAVFCLVPLARRLSNSVWAAPVVVLIAGLLVKMPMYYVNWSRYTQLAGQVILPVAIYLVWVMLDELPSRLSSLAVSILAAIGLLLTHYRVAVFYALFLIAYLVFDAGRRKLRYILQQYIWLGLGVGLLFLPWLLRISKGEILETFFHQITTPSAKVSEFTRQYNEMGPLTNYLPVVVWLAFLFAAGWALWRNERGLRTMLGWSILVLLAANPDWLGLPGMGSLGNFTVMIASYIPAALMIGSAVAWLIERLVPIGRWAPDIQRAIILNLVAVLFAVGIWGARQRLADVDISTYSLVTRPDLRAAAWMDDNLPKTSILLVNNFPAFVTARVGSDAGWWLPLIAHRQIVLPPLQSLAEKGESSYTNLNRLMSYIDTNGLSAPGLLEKLQKNQITHIYIGQQQGKVNSQGEYFSVDEMLLSPFFQPIYHQDRTWVFEIVNPK